MTARSHVLVVSSELVQPVRMRKLVKQVNELACLWETRAIISIARKPKIIPNSRRKYTKLCGTTEGISTTENRHNIQDYNQQTNHYLIRKTPKCIDSKLNHHTSSLVCVSFPYDKERVHGSREH